GSLGRLKVTVLRSLPLVREPLGLCTRKLQAGPVRPRGSSPLPPAAIDPNNGREMDDSLRTPASIQRPTWVFGSFRSARVRQQTGSRSRFCRRSSMKRRDSSHPTAIGWRTPPTNRESAKCTYVRFLRADGKWRISTAGGEQPRWRGDGKELFYAAADGKMTAVAVKAELGSKPSFEPGVPIPLFDAH